MEYKIKALSIYECGQRKDKEGNPHQEDWLYPGHGQVDSDHDRMFILCDGMGTGPGAASESGAAISILRTLLQSGA